MAQTMILDSIATAAKTQGQTPGTPAAPAASDAVNFGDVLASLTGDLGIASLFAMPEIAAAATTGEAGAAKAVALENLAAGTPAKAQSIEELLNALKAALKGGSADAAKAVAAVEGGTAKEDGKETGEEKNGAQALSLLLAALLPNASAAVTPAQTVPVVEDGATAPAATVAVQDAPAQDNAPVVPAVSTDAAGQIAADVLAKMGTEAAAAAKNAPVPQDADVAQATATSTAQATANKAALVADASTASTQGDATATVATVAEGDATPSTRSTTAKPASRHAEAVVEAVKTDAPAAQAAPMTDGTQSQQQVSTDVAAAQPAESKPTVAETMAQASDDAKSAPEAEKTQQKDAKPTVEMPQAVAQVTTQAAQAAVVAAGQTVDREVVRTRGASTETGKAIEAAGGLRSDAAAKTDDSAATSQVARADQERIIARIANAMSQGEESGRSTIRMRLFPPELGTVRLEVTSFRGTVTARIETSTPEAQGVINSNLAGLRSQLADSGVNLRDVQVQYRNAAAYASPDRQGGQGGYSTPRQPRRESFEAPVEGIEAADSRGVNETSGLLDVLA